MRGSRPTSSKNSSPAEFLISPRHRHPLHTVRVGRKESAKAKVEKERDRGGGVDKEGRHCHARVFHRLFHPRLPASTPLSLHTLPPRASGHRHPLATTEGSSSDGGGGGSVFLITTAIFFSSRDDAAAKRYRNISAQRINPARPPSRRFSFKNFTIDEDRWRTSRRTPPTRYGRTSLVCFLRIVWYRINGATNFYSFEIRSLG